MWLAVEHDWAALLGCACDEEPAAIRAQPADHAGGTAADAALQARPKGVDHVNAAAA